MSTTDQTNQNFIDLIESAILIARSLKVKGATVERVDATIKRLQNYSNLASSGKLPRISNGEVPEGTGLGLVKSIGEWTEDDEFLDAVFEVEQYYKESM
ncbi:hypothetical protein [Agarivorans gilvus]|uniref:Uncharacterized protein n=1 Tax=Agarivorans gilvus TaxID=680279 RepID=A0ABQ1I7Z4_9ALTE|nr:hypothetical protein [Agarivorans gilvus]GGB22179.1 hypothetical protein GCM10007414_39460 [Agarivorans gilvus]